MNTLFCEMSWRALLDTCRSHELPFGTVKAQLDSAMVRLVAMSEYRDFDMSNGYDPDHVYVEFEGSEFRRMESTDPVFVMIEARLVPDGNDYDPNATPSPDAMPPYQDERDDGDYDQVPDGNDDDDEYEEDELAESWHAAAADDDDDEYNYEYGYDEYDDHECNDPDASVLPNHCGEVSPPAGSADNDPLVADLVGRYVTFVGDNVGHCRTVTGVDFDQINGYRRLSRIRITHLVGWKDQTNWMKVKTFLSKLEPGPDHDLYHAAAMPPVDEIPF